jgi:hypothetical protein
MSSQVASGGALPPPHCPEAVTAERQPRNIVMATVIALAVAVLILFAAVLPAEYGYDPLRTGSLLGLTALSEGSTGAITPQPARYRTETIEFVLGPYEFLEYKYRLEKGGSIVYSWVATGPVIYDFHAEPDDAPDGYAESFDKSQAPEAHGNYVAPFPGIHGWFWENPGSKAVTITLSSAGFYSAATEFRDNDQSTRTFTNDR